MRRRMEVVVVAVDDTREVRTLMKAKTLSRTLTKPLSSRVILSQRFWIKVNILLGSREFHFIRINSLTPDWFGKGEIQETCNMTPMNTYNDKISWWMNECEAIFEKSLVHFLAEKVVFVPSSKRDITATIADFFIISIHLITYHLYSKISTTFQFG